MILNSLSTKIHWRMISHCEWLMTNLSFFTAVFLSGLKIHKKESKLKCTNYRPILLLSNPGKILKKLIYNRIYDFLENTS